MARNGGTTVLSLEWGWEMFFQLGETQSEFLLLWEIMLFVERQQGLILIQPTTSVITMSNINTHKATSLTPRDVFSLQKCHWRSEVIGCCIPINYEWMNRYINTMNQHTTYIVNNSSMLPSCRTVCMLLMKQQAECESRCQKQIWVFLLRKISFCEVKRWKTIWILGFVFWFNLANEEEGDGHTEKRGSLKRCRGGCERF